MTTTSVRTTARRLDEVPGAAGSHLLGMTTAFRRDVLGSLLDGFRTHGDLVTFRFGPRLGPGRQLVLAAFDPDHVRVVLSESERSFGKQTVGFTVLSELLGRGLLTSEGAQWRRQRRTLAPLFTPRRVAGYRALMAAEADRVIIDPPPGGVVDLHLLMMRYTLRVVGRALFGEDVDDAIPALHRLVPLGGELTVARTLQATRLPLSWPTPRNRRVRSVRDAQYAIVEQILTRHGGTADGHRTDRDDLVTRLMAARDPETGQPLSDREIRDQVLVFLLAGHETTAGALTFTVHLLGRDPKLQEKVAADPALVRAALLEGMRLYPPAYLTERVATVDTELGGVAVPRGTPVLVSPWVTHRHPDYWPDPDRFDPARFVAGANQDRPRFAYFPFGGGPRGCIGEHFAMLEAVELLTRLLARYRVEALDPRLRTDTHVTLRPAGVVRVRLTPR